MIGTLLAALGGLMLGYGIGLEHGHQRGRREFAGQIAQALNDGRLVKPEDG